MKTLNISDETYELIKGQLGEDETIDINSFEEIIGKKFFIRTVTYHLVGKVEKIIGHFLVLSKSSWIADSGRFSDMLKDGFSDTAEIEPTGTAFVNINSITDMFEWKKELPTKQQ